MIWNFAVIFYSWHQVSSPKFIWILEGEKIIASKNMNFLLRVSISWGFWPVVYIDILPFYGYVCLHATHIVSEKSLYKIWFSTPLRFHFVRQWCCYYPKQHTHARTHSTANSLKHVWHQRKWHFSYFRHTSGEVRLKRFIFDGSW